MPLYRWQQYTPQLAADVWVAPNAQVIGHTSIAAGSSIWFGCVLRGDVGLISIGENTNIQDLSLLHMNQGQTPLQIGNYCTVGHHVTLHGCTLHDYAFVGIGATVLDGCELGSYALLAAGSLLPPGKKIAAYTVAMGAPAKEIREITTTEKQMITNTPSHYNSLKDIYKDQQKFQQHFN